MCAIIDANVANEILSSSQSEAGFEFFKWIQDGHGKLISGGKNRHELNKCGEEYRQWASQARSSGMLVEVSDQAVAKREEQLKHSGLIQSDDPHIIALAQLSGARLLFSNDLKLHKDFRKRELIDQPRGKIYSTSKGSSFRGEHKSLLRNKNICKRPPRP